MRKIQRLIELTVALLMAFAIILALVYHFTLTIHIEKTTYCYDADLCWEVEVEVIQNDLFGIAPYRGHQIKG